MSNKYKQCVLFTVIVISMVSFLPSLNVLSQETQEAVVDTATRHRQEQAELRERQRKERAEERARKREERIRTKQEKKEERTRKRQEQKQVRGESLKTKYIAKQQIRERKKEIRKAKHKSATIEVIADSEDPLFIIEAKVTKAKTKYLKLKDVDLNYKIKIQNQTPKIITTVSLVWDRSIPFNKSSEITRETKISKPIIPYEKRVVEYNEVDSKREGETYRVKITKVVFEDGSQWNNPL